MSTSDYSCFAAPIAISILPATNSECSCSTRIRNVTVMKTATRARAIKAPKAPNQDSKRSFITNEDPFAVFARDIAQYRLLTSAEELELTTLVARLRKHKQVRKSLPESSENSDVDSEIAKSLDISVEKLLEERSAGLAARDALVAANLRLVVKIARSVLKRRVGGDNSTKSNRSGVSLLDLVQEGTLGLIYSTETFDPTRGVKFSTFAFRSIKWFCERAVALHQLAIRVPDRVIMASNRLSGARAEFFTETGTWPTDKQLAQLRPDINVKAVRRADRLMRSPVALDKPLLLSAPGSGDSASTIADFLSADPEYEPETIVQRDLSGEQVRQAVRKCLKPREAKILVLRFGLDPRNPETVAVKSIAETFELSEVRVHQIVRASLEKLRKNDPELALLM